ncbi:MAG: sn-glycerol-3-phosphate ABC transporter ATP-binding protein UgpC, partial [Rhizobium oryzihabitans]
RLIHGMIGDQNLTVAFSPEVEVPATLSVAISPDKLHFFSSETGKRISGKVEQSVMQASELATA